MKLLHPASLSVAVLLLLAASPAAAQRFPFEHTVSVAGPVTVEIVTDRGRIEVTEGAPGRVAAAATRPSDITCSLKIRCSSTS